jgi:hypothetical protein
MRSAVFALYEDETFRSGLHAKAMFLTSSAHSEGSPLSHEWKAEGEHRGKETDNLLSDDLFSEDLDSDS